VFRTRLSIRFAQQYYTITTRLCQSRLSFLASAALALGKRGKGKHLLPLLWPRWPQGSESSRTRMTSLLVLSKMCLYAQLRWSKRAIMNHRQSSMINRQTWFVSSTIITWLWQFTSTIMSNMSLFHYTHVNQPNNLNHDGESRQTNRVLWKRSTHCTEISINNVNYDNNFNSFPVGYSTEIYWFMCKPSDVHLT